jgi:hypothetical protein
LPVSIRLRPRRRSLYKSVIDKRSLTSKDKDGIQSRLK